MQLGPGTKVLDELREAQWLHAFAPRPGSEGFTAQLLDAALRTQAPARGDRARAADWSIRTCRVKTLHQLGPLPRLLALALAAHPPAGTSEEESSADQAHLARMCGLAPQSLLHTLALLADTHFLHSWAHDLTHEDVRWKLALPEQPSPGHRPETPHRAPTTQRLEPQPTGKTAPQQPVDDPSPVSPETRRPPPNAAPRPAQRRRLPGRGLAGI
ncbi:hypothetical protein ACN24L_38045 [Streptomyces microflavus]